MLRRRLMSTIALVLFAIGLAGLGGYFGWSEGFAAGLASGTQGGAAFTPYGFGLFPLFFGIGLLFKLLFFLFLFFILARIFGFFAWRMAGGPRGGPWGKHRRWHQGEKPDKHDESHRGSEDSSTQDTQ